MQHRARPIHAEISDRGPKSGTPLFEKKYTVQLCPSCERTLKISFTGFMPKGLSDFSSCANASQTRQGTKAGRSKTGFPLPGGSCFSDFSKDMCGAPGPRAHPDHGRSYSDSNTYPSDFSVLSALSSAPAFADETVCSSVMHPG